MNNLVIYYSRADENYMGGRVKNIAKGNTEYIAEYLRDNFNADLFKVETVKEYAQAYMDCIREAQKELDNDERPQLKHYLSDVSKYDNIFIAGPCWWGTYPMAIFSAIEDIDFTGKKIFPIMTHAGSRMGKSESDLKSVVKGAEIAQGLPIKGSDCPNAEKTVVNWVNQNIYGG